MNVKSLVSSSLKNKTRTHHENTFNFNWDKKEFPEFQGVVLKFARFLDLGVHFFLGISTKSDNPPDSGHVTRVLRCHVSAPAHLAGAAARVARGEQREQAETGHQHGQQGEPQPALAKLTISVITGTNVIICNQISVNIYQKWICLIWDQGQIINHPTTTGENLLRWKL